MFGDAATEQPHDWVQLGTIPEDGGGQTRTITQGAGRTRTGAPEAAAAAAAGGGGRQPTSRRVGRDTISFGGFAVPRRRIRIIGLDAPPPGVRRACLVTKGQFWGGCYFFG
jgi:hypothetical protein